ncbi:MAG: hypothetical protein RR646_06295 [Erysipelotrichaceae bacterium]
MASCGAPPSSLIIMNLLATSVFTHYNKVSPIKDLDVTPPKVNSTNIDYIDDAFSGKHKPIIDYKYDVDPIEKVGTNEIDIKSNNDKKNVDIKDSFLSTKGASGAGKKYSPVNPCDKISQEVAESFRGATFTEKVLTEDTIMYRVSGGKVGEVGSYLSKTPQGGGLQSQLDLALNPVWGNTTENVIKVIVPKGTVIYEGVAAPQNILDSFGNTISTLTVGGNQIYILKVDARWFK